MITIRGLVLVLMAGAVTLPSASTLSADGTGRVGFSIQVGAFREVRNAEALTAALQEKGLDAFYFRNDRGFFAVRFGDFPTRQEAQDKARQLSAEKIIDSYYLTPPPPPADQGMKRAAASGTESKAAPESDLGFVAARTAERFVGIPYRWGGNNVAEGLDCSGFSRAVYYLVGLNIPRTAADQYRAGRTVDKKNLKDGDLVFFEDPGGCICHVGIYVGNERFVHAPKRGQDIMMSTLEDSLGTRKFAGARRYFP